MITPRAAVLGSALPALVIVTLVVVPGARSAVGFDARAAAAPVSASEPTARPAAEPVAASTAGSGPEERRALRLLRRSVRVGSALGFSGTQIVTAWHGQGATSEVLDVAQHAGGGRTVTARGVGDGSSASEPAERLVSQPPVADGSVGPAGRALAALAAGWDLKVSGHQDIAGRPAVEVVAARGGHIGARIWLDDATGLLVRQDVLDPAGRLQRMTTFIELRVGSPAVPAGPQEAPAAWGQVAGAAGLQRWRDQGYRCPETLPAGYRLLDVRSESAAGEPVLQLVYGDGLSAVSVFQQPGVLDPTNLTGLTRTGAGDGAVYERSGWPELRVWQSGRTVITAVGDAEPADLGAVLSVFPRQAPPDRGALRSLHDAMESALARFTG